ncbi:hypothetical protein VAA_04318 [Vibrio anguillarum 775]|nr:hypothetical protein VAA_04318 [Vibrio anguillarum 775]
MMQGALISSWIAASKNWNPTKRELSGVFFILVT